MRHPSRFSGTVLRRRYGADPAILGTAIQVNGAPHTVIGVMAKGAALPGPLAEASDLLLSMHMAYK